MALPTVYTEGDLIDYLVLVLGEAGAVLGLDADAPIMAEVVNDTLLAYGVADLAEATDIPRLRALGRWRAWLAAVDSLAGYYTVSLPAEGGQLTLSQLSDQATRRLQAAEIEAGAYGSGYALSVRPLSDPRDPYA